MGDFSTDFRHKKKLNKNKIRSVFLFLFFSFTSHVLGKKGLFTRVTTYNRPSVFSFSFHLFHTF
jgi:hypothetical protein